LLDYESPGEQERRNLKTFLKKVAKAEEFLLEHVRVDRERFNIDILVTNGCGQAVIIENKIWAGDQENQLRRYNDTIESQGFESPILVYLTPYGRKPSKNSVGDLLSRTTSVGYRDRAFREWLQECQRAAYDEPELRESIAQYRVLVQELTGTNYSEEYMQDLKKLCLEPDNLALLHDLKIAADEAWIDLIREMFREIEARIRETIPGMLEKQRFSNETVIYERVKQLVKGGRKTHIGLYSGIGGGAELGIEINNWQEALLYGVRCKRERSRERHNVIKGELPVRGYTSGMWPWWSYPIVPQNPSPREPSKEHLQLLANQKTRQEFVWRVVEDVRTLREQVEASGLIIE